MPLTLEELQGFQADAGVGSQRGRQLRFFHCTLPLVLLREGEGERPLYIAPRLTA